MRKVSGIRALHSVATLGLLSFIGALFTGFVFTGLVITTTAFPALSFADVEAIAETGAQAAGSSEMKPSGYPNLQIANPRNLSGRVVFTYAKRGQNPDILVLDFDQMKVTPLVETEAVDEYARWSPDGTKVAFHSDMGGDREIYVIDYDGNNLKNLTNNDVKDEDPDWSPDGKRIVFHSARAGKGYNIFTMDPDGKNVEQLTKSTKRNTVPRWSPRGDEIIFSYDGTWPGWDILLLDLNTKETKSLSSGFLSFCRASWSPDGGSYVYSYGGGKSVDLWLQEKGKKDSVKLTTRSGKEYDAAWSKDGSIILFSGELTAGKADYQMWGLDMATKEVFQVTSNLKGAIRYPHWVELPSLGDIKKRISKKLEQG